MIRALQALLLFAALLGLAGQAMAMAAVQPVASSSPTASPMTDDCMEMTADREDSKPQPCDGTFKCMLAMGCLSLNLIAEFGAPRNGGQVRSTEEYWPVVAILRGASFAPEPDPPTTFA
jgi:hypothetical protein